MFQQQLLAAIDLGSNSFRLSIGRIVNEGEIEQIFSVDAMKETVRLAAGLDENKNLNQETMDRAIAVLERFGERIRSFHPNRVRAVATNTFRVARNIKELLPRAEAALGFPIEIIAGTEEARLIFSGVVHSLPPSNEQRLVVDIGGGSTEFIIGKQLNPKLMASLYMGCVSFTKRFFPKGEITEKAFNLAELAARKEVETIAKQYKRLGWDLALGSSGTAKALLGTLRETGISESGITLEGMQKLKKLLIKQGTTKTLEVPGLKDDRKEVLPAGLSIMIGLFKELEIEIMHQGDGALRIGVLYDLLGRDANHDKRNESVQLFKKRYHIDLKQALRVKSLALNFFQQLHLEDPEIKQALGWAADLHEIGLTISQSDYHKHTAYVLANADMPGFSKDDQSLLAFLTVGHLGKLDKIKDQKRKNEIWLALLSLRLAVLLMRRRQALLSEPLNLTREEDQVTIHVRERWLKQHPLSRYSLEHEVEEWKKIGFNLVLKSNSLPLTIATPLSA